MNDKKKNEAIDEFYAGFGQVPIIDQFNAKPSEIINWGVAMSNLFEKFYNRAYTEGYKDATEIKI